MTAKFSTIEEYVKACPANVQSILERIRQIIHAATPGVTEGISYQMPGFKLNGKGLISLAAWNEHIAIYPIPARSGEFEKELSPYISGKGTLRFPLDKPIPFKLIEAIVKARIEQIDKK